MNFIPRCISKIHHNIMPLYGRGSYIIDNKGKTFLDMTSGIGALSLGHNHPSVNRYVKKQIDDIVHVPQQVFQSNIQLEKLNEIVYETMPNKYLNQFFFVNSGSEATDNAIKIARNYNRRTNVLAFKRGFHGRTIGALSINSSNNFCKKNAGPFLPGIYYCDPFNEQSLDEVFQLYSNPEDISCVILESVQGEGGIIDIPIHFIKQLRNVCKENNIVIIADEVQCGVMRTGTMWNIQSKIMDPDIITFGKGIANGYPLAGLATTSEIMDKMSQGILGGTYGGNALACAAAYKTLQIIQMTDFQINVKSTMIKNNIKLIDGIKEVRTQGLMIAIELTEPSLTPKLVSGLRENGALVLTAGFDSSIIRLLPPLNISYSEIQEFISIFTEEMENINKNK